MLEAIYGLVFMFFYYPLEKFIDFTSLDLPKTEEETEVGVDEFCQHFRKLFVTNLV
jgi:hypothetical protein